MSTDEFPLKLLKIHLQFKIPLEVAQDRISSKLQNSKNRRIINRIHISIQSRNLWVMQDHKQQISFVILLASFNIWNLNYLKLTNLKLKYYKTCNLYERKSLKMIINIARIEMSWHICKHRTSILVNNSIGRSKWEKSNQTLSDSFS